MFVDIIRNPYSQLSGCLWWLKIRGTTKTTTLPEKKTTFLKKLFSYEVPAFWPLVIHLELLENRERFAVFFCDEIIILVCHLGWCDILHEWNHCGLDFHFVNCWCSVLHLNRRKWCDNISCFDQDMVLSNNVNTSVNKPNTVRAGRAKAFLPVFIAVEEALVFIFTWIFCVRWQPQLCTWCTAVCVLGDWSREINKKENFPVTCCSVAILPYWVGK